MNVLFVCTGNVCRSPMAEGFLRDQAIRRGLDIVARSTGTHAWNGRAATIDGRRVMTELGVPIDDHRTLELDRELMDWADLVICLATEHLRETAVRATRTSISTASEPNSTASISAERKVLSPGRGVRAARAALVRSPAIAREAARPWSFT